MRIALFTPRPQRRGAELFSRELAGELRRRGHEALEVYLYPPPAQGGLPATGGEIRLAAGRSRLERFFGWDPRVARRLRRVLVEFRPEVIQASGGATVKYAALTAGPLPGPPLLVYRNIGEPDRWIRGWRRRWLYHRLVFPRVGAAVTVTRGHLPRLEQICANARSVRHIPRSIDVGGLAPVRPRAAVRATLDTPADAPVILFAGKLSPEKRVDRLLRAFGVAAARVPDAHLWIAGDGPLAGELSELADGLEVAGRVRFLGARDDVGDLLAASDLVALTSDTEGVPTILREAACAGRAVVATRVGGVEEAVADGETGLLTDRDDETALADALAALAGDADRRRRMGEAAARHFRESGLTIEAVVEAYLELYRQGLTRPETEAAG